MIRVRLQIGPRAVAKNALFDSRGDHFGVSLQPLEHDFGDASGGQSAEIAPMFGCSRADANAVGRFTRELFAAARVPQSKAAHRTNSRDWVGSRRMPVCMCVQ